MRKCLTCKGYGAFPTGHDELGRKHPPLPCDCCGGTGRVPGDPPSKGCLLTTVLVLLASFMASITSWSFSASNALKGFVPAAAPEGPAWTANDGGILSPADGRARASIPVDVSADYNLRLAVKRVAGGGPLRIILPLEDQHIALEIDGEAQKSGFIVTGPFENGDESAADHEGVLEADKAVVLLVEVFGYPKDSDVTVGVRSGMSKFCSWTGPRRRLGVPDDWFEGEAAAVVLGSENASFQVNEMSYVGVERHEFVTVIVALVIFIGLFFVADIARKD